MSIPWGSIISAGGSLLGGLFGQSKEDERYEQQLAHTDKWNERSYGLARESFDWQKAHIQNRVKDAQKAGIHPLFALGAPGASASFSAGGLGGQSPTGSALGSGIASAASAIGGAVGNRKLAGLNAELVGAQIGEIESRTRLNELKVLEQAANATRPATTYGLGPETSITRHPLGQPYETRKGSGPRAYERYTRPDGTTGLKYTEDMQMDELGQLVVGGQEVGHYFTPWLKRKIQELLFEQFTAQPQSMYRGRTR